MPLAPWVFASATLGFVTIPGRLHTALAAPVAAGTATLIVNGVSGAVQVLARRGAGRPRLRGGRRGAAHPDPGAGRTAVRGPGVRVRIVSARRADRSGGRRAATPARRPDGLFYVVTYIGFGLPLILASVRPGVATAILSGMAVLAMTAAVGRAARLRRDDHRQN